MGLFFHCCVEADAFQNFQAILEKTVSADLLSGKWAALYHQDIDSLTRQFHSSQAACRAGTNHQNVGLQISVQVLSHPGCIRKNAEFLTGAIIITGGMETVQRKAPSAKIE